MAIQRVSAADLDMAPTMSPNDPDARMKLLDSKPFDELTPAERAELTAYKEEHDEEHLKSVGRLSSIPTSSTPVTPVPHQDVSSVTGGPVNYIPTTVTAPPPQSSTLGSVPVPQVRKPVDVQPVQSGMLAVSSKKDEMIIPIRAVTEFIAEVMGNDFGYISKPTAKQLVDLIPKDAALLAMAENRDSALKFLYHDDPEVVDQAIRIAFDVSDEASVTVYKKMIDMPQVTINPWI